MFKHLLVPLTGQPADRAALAAALQIARAHDAHVDGLFIRPHPADAVPLLGEGMSGAMIDDIVRAAEAETKALMEASRRLFDDMTATAAVACADAPPAAPAATARWREKLGRAEEVLAHEGRVTDMVVLTRSDEDIHGRLTAAAETALLDSGRPVLLVPENWSGAVGRKVAAAWNGRTEAARAVAGAMPFLQGADAVTVLTAVTGATPVDAAGAANASLIDYLAWRGVQAQGRIVAPGGASVGAALIAAARAADCDLLVQGGYGHSRMREMIMGGVTRHMLAAADLPVLMAH